MGRFSCWQVSGCYCYERLRDEQEKTNIFSVSLLGLQRPEFSKMQLFLFVIKIPNITFCSSNFSIFLLKEGFAFCQQQQPPLGGIFVNLQIGEFANW
ncbi:MAG: hypothetical protein ABJQ38_09290 [Flavobacteriaceae bacterium]